MKVAAWYIGLYKDRLQKFYKSLVIAGRNHFKKHYETKHSFHTQNL